MRPIVKSKLLKESQLCDWGEFVKIRDNEYVDLDLKIDQVSHTLVLSLFVSELITVRESHSLEVELKKFLHKQFKEKLI
jgi:hypothetical protein|tara:strand:- start:269 stop:505 length:237 start_codon:yes stop_codon:yes gene_type:complete